MATSLTMSLSLVILGLCDYSSLPSLPWLPLLSLSLYLLAAPMGLCSIPFIIMPELFPPEVIPLA